MSAPRVVTNSSSLINRTIQSGGSVGGGKKAGIGNSVYMRVYNIGTSYEYRMPQTSPNIRQMLLLTTRNPTQYGRGSYTVTHSGTLMG